MHAHRLAGAGVVDHRLDLADAVGPGVELLADAVGGALARLLELLQERGRPVAPDQVVQARLADGVADARLRGEVADHHLRHAAVGADERRGVLLQPVVAHVAHRRDLQALAEEVARGCVARARGHAADVGRVPDARGERDEPAVCEDRRHHDHVVRVRAAAVVRVAREVGVALAHVGGGVELEEAVDAGGQTAHVAGVGAARDEASGCVEQPAAEVVGLADDGGEARAEHGVLHLADDAVEACAHHLEGDDVERGAGHGAHDTPFRVYWAWAEALGPFHRVAHSSSGPGHRPLKAEITGSNPVCATTAAPRAILSAVYS